MNSDLFNLMKTATSAAHGGTAAAFELVCHRALEREMAKQVQDQSVITVFRMLIAELAELRPALSSTQCPGE